MAANAKSRPDARRTKALKALLRQVERAVDRFYPYFVIAGWTWVGRNVPTRKELAQEIENRVALLLSRPDLDSSLSGGIRVWVERDEGEVVGAGVGFEDTIETWL